MKFAKAELRELDADFQHEVNKSAWVIVQFNPETLKVTFANQTATPSGAGDQHGTPARQFVGAGTTKLTVQLWFDVTVLDPSLPDQPTDVRKLTQKVAYFITPQQKTGGKLLPPALRFLWGSFEFDGVMDSLEETLEFFSEDGKPLRAGVSLSMSQQKIEAFAFRPAPAKTPPGARKGPGGAAPGTSPLTSVVAGATLQLIADVLGVGPIWAAVGIANAIENPRQLKTGQLIDGGAGARAKGK
jgi:contractile injection system tube protein